MADKRTFDKILAKGIRKNEYFTALILVDDEGLPISHVLREKTATINPKQCASILRLVFSPGEIYGKSNQAGHALVSLCLIDGQIILVINLANGLLGVFLEPLGWPVNADDIHFLLEDLKQVLPELGEEDSGLLKDLKIKQTQPSAIHQLTDELITEIYQILTSLGKGMLGREPFIISAGGDQYYTEFGQTIGSIPEITDVYIYPDDFTMAELYKMNQSDLKMKIGGQYLSNIQKGEEVSEIMQKTLLFAFFYTGNQAIINAPISQHDNIVVQLTYKTTDIHIGFKSIISPLYQAIQTLKESAPCRKCAKIEEILQYLSIGTDELQTQIQQKLDMGEKDAARALMKRAAVLFKGQQNYNLAGDYLKWIGYTLYEDGDLNESKKYYIKAVKEHKYGGHLEHAAESLIDLASLEENNQEVAAALEHFMEAKQTYEELGDEESQQMVQQSIDQLLMSYKEALKSYLLEDNSSVFPVELLADHFELSEMVIKKILQELIEANEIPGQIDLANNRYSKREQTTRQETETGGISIEQAGAAQKGTPLIVSGTGKGRDVPKLSYSYASKQAEKIKAQNSKINSKLSDLEREFKRRNVKMSSFLKYQTFLNRKSFNEHQLKIYENMIQTNSDSGLPTICFVCLKPIQDDDEICICPTGHGVHAPCVSSWVRNQTKCPVCNAKLFPNILQMTYAKHANSTFDPEYIMSLQRHLEQTLREMNFLETLDREDLKLYQKSIEEREKRRELEKKLMFKEQEVDELKSILKTMKESAKKTHKSSFSEDEMFY